MKKFILIFLMCYFGEERVNSQCTVDMEDEDGTCYGLTYMIGPLTGPISGWSYHWSPSTGLTNPNIANPGASPATTTTYTLTVTNSQCGTFNAGSVTVYVYYFPITVSPSGPITYYYQYEGTEKVTLAANTGGSWYRSSDATPSMDDTPLTDWMDSPVYDVSMTGSGTQTNYYYCANLCFTSNVVAVTTIGCIYDNQYPVSIVHNYYSYGNCGPTLPATVTQPNPGTSPTYSWILYGGNEARWNLSNTSIQSPTLSYNSGGTPPNAEGVRTRAVAANGTEIRMQWGVGYFTQSNCTPRMVNGGIPEEDRPAVTNTIISPNPTNGKITIKSKNALEKIEVYNSVGVLVKSIDFNKQNTVTMETTGLPAGIYNLRFVSDKGVEILKLMVR